ncbi:peptidase inhibitor family I36 protein [Streptomyces sp. NPDC101149]|uniref:peptidase inhibitor family I36 protein n=1 Tax=Streptomyces sp. NPDC101149 TaxID=3366113 RepID=UPI00380F0858
MKPLFPKIGVVLGAAALVATGALVTAGPATAAYSDCPSGALCAYLGTGGYGDPGTVWGNNTNLLQYNKFNNAESLYNNGNNCDVTVYSGLNYTGSAAVALRGWTYSPLYSPWKDNVASNRWC